jgi:hypothetical protein
MMPDIFSRNLVDTPALSSKFMRRPGCAEVSKCNHSIAIQWLPIYSDHPVIFPLTKLIRVLAMSVKQNICNKCKLRNRCGDLPGFCALIYYTPVVLLVFMLFYFFLTMDL